MPRIVVFRQNEPNRYVTLNVPDSRLTVECVKLSKSQYSKVETLTRLDNNLCLQCRGYPAAFCILADSRKLLPVTPWHIVPSKDSAARQAQLGTLAISN